MLCDIAQVSRCGYYKHLKLPSKSNNDYLLIKEIFEKGKAKLGWRSSERPCGRDHRASCLNFK